MALAIFLISWLGRSLTSCLVKSCSQRVYAGFLAWAVSSGTRALVKAVNCGFVLGLKRGIEPRSMDLVGSLASDITLLLGAVRLRVRFKSMSPNRSSACFRSASCSVRRSFSRLAARSSSESLSSSDSSSARRRAAAAWCSAIRWERLFLFANASASAFALAAAAFWAFSRSTSLSSAASQSSRTYLPRVSPPIIP